ncbi:MAG: glycosyltransferase family protein [Lachnospiraceae bacterium]|nr:glycosyltransferase family protein [Lachnospiraceae bacterium]
MKYLAMIQARCGSTRLPNKVLKDICGKPQLQRVIERAGRAAHVDEVMVITSIHKENLPILRLCAELGIRVGVGSEEDVLDRYYQTARLIRPDYVIRITADCPLFDGRLLDAAIEQMGAETDFCGMMSEEFADGLDLEIMRFSALERAWREAEHSFEREHVTQYIRRHPELFSIMDFRSPVGYFGEHRWTVDEPEDYELVSRIYTHFIKEAGVEDFGYREVLDYVNAHPELSALNQKYSRNEGLEKSIREDRLV